MVWIFVVLGAVVVFAIAAAFVGSEAFRLGHTPTTTVFDLDEAVEAVADGLPPEHAVGLTYKEVRSLLRFSLDHLETKGLSVRAGTDPELADTPDVVIADDDAVAVVLGRADAVGLAVSDEAVLVVLDLLLAHLAEIGALGPEA